MGAADSRTVANATRWTMESAGTAEGELVDPEPANPRFQGAGRYTERDGGAIRARDASSGRSQGVLDEMTLTIFPGDGRCGLLGNHRGFLQGQFEVAHLEPFVACQDDRALDKVLQLPHVAGPGI